MLASYDVISKWIAQWETHFVEPAIFGTSDPEQIAEHIDTFCRKELGEPVAEFLFYETSIGIVCGVCLRDGRRVVVKAHQPARSPEILRAIVGVQRYLRQRDYPCTTPIIDPRPLALSMATVDELNDRGMYHQADEPGIRRSMAELLARLHHLTSQPESIPGIDVRVLDSRLPEGVLWPTPHSNIFDFVATSAGAEWIDEIAREAQVMKLRGAGKLVLGHTDWGVKHFRYVGENVSVIYDWDSLTFDREPIIVGHAASYFTYTTLFGEARTPTPEETRAFIAEYEVARGVPFTVEEQKTLQAGMLYALAYQARCEHALHPQEREFTEGSCRALLKVTSCLFL